MATVAITFKENKIGKKGTAPIYMEVRHNSTKALINTGYTISPEQWNGKMPAFVKGRGCAPINSELNHMLLNAQNKIQKMQGEIHHLTIQELKERLNPWYTPFKERELAARKISLVQRLIEYQEAGGLSEGTQKIFQRTINAVSAYLEETDESDMRSIADIDREWLYAFQEWLRENDNGTNTIAIHLRNIRTVINVAIDDELIIKNPFRKFSIKEEQTERQPMTMEQLELLLTADLEPWQVEWIDLYKACFYLMGINMVDLSKLVHADRDGYIRYKRTKTDKKGGKARIISIHVEPELQALIDKYQSETHLFGVFDRYKDYKDVTKHMMHAVKCIGAKTKKNDSKRLRGRNYGPARKDLSQSPLADVCQYSARRTWSTLAINECDIPPTTIALCLGHALSGLEVTMRYARIDQKKIDAANRAVIDLLNQIAASKPSKQ